MKKRLFTLILSLAIIFSSVFLCNAVVERNADDYKTEKLGIVIRNENISDSDWWIEHDILGIDSIESVVPRFSDADGDTLYDVYSVTPGTEGINNLKAELENCEIIDYVGLIGYVSDELSVFDVTLDGKLSAADARFALRCAVNLEDYTAMQLQKGDVDGDRRFTASDARNILRCSVGLPVEIEEKYDFTIDCVLVIVKEEYMPDTTELTPDFFGSDLINDVEYLLGNRSYAVYLKDPGEENLFELLQYLKGCEKAESVDLNWYGQLGI